MRADGAEFDLLCSAARPTPDLVKIRQLLDKGVHGATLLDLAAHHGVRPSLLRALSDLSWHAVPPGLREELETFRHRQMLRSLSVAAELAELAAAFAVSAIEFATFKGPVLALQLYGDLALREYADIDIIVPPGHLEQAEEVLARRGYRNTQGDRAFRDAFLRHQRQYAFTRQGAAASIDLHWDFCGQRLPFPVRPSEIWPALTRVVIGGTPVPTIGGEELALLLAGHGTKEAWYSVGWICDFAMVVERMRKLDWSTIHARARRNGSGVSILLACALAETLLQVPVPAALAAALDRERSVLRLAGDIAQRLRVQVPTDGPRPNLHDLLLCDRVGDKVRVTIATAMTCTPSDYEAFPLPPALWPAYRVTRPVRLAAGLVTRGLRRLRRRAAV